ncbi:RNA/RNP complex-1-interacting phosphatase [Discoglossus pictus]
MLRTFFRPVSDLRVAARLHTSTRSMGKNKNYLPDRWTEYTSVGKRIPGTRFIAFKVPLKKLFDNKLEQWQRFSSSDLIQEIQSQNEELGLIVDLTCTTRYYSPEELPETLHYAKLFTAGHEIPNDETIHQFKCIVRQFLSENTDNDKLIGVHCTHGLNRTGYLVCRYLIDVVGMVPSEAIEKFNKSRGHCIERKNYLDDLTHGEKRNNSEFDKPRLPPPRYQERVPNPHDARTFTPPVPPSHFCADSVNGPRLLTHRHPYPPHVYNMPVQDMQAPMYGFPPRQDHPHRHSRGNDHRHLHQNRKHYSHYNGERSERRYNNPGHGSNSRWSGHTGPYKRHPGEDSGKKYQE